MYIYIFFSLWEDVEWILIMIMRKKEKKNQQYLMWETFEIFSSSEETAMFGLYKELCMINISLFWDWLGL